MYGESSVSPWTTLWNWKNCWWVIIIGCVINLNEYNCALLKSPWGWFLTSEHSTIENNIGKNNSYRELIVYYRRVRWFTCSSVEIKNSRLDRLYMCLVGVPNVSLLSLLSCALLLIYISALLDSPRDRW